MLPVFIKLRKKMAVINIHEGEEDYTILVWVCLASEIW